MSEERIQESTRQLVEDHAVPVEAMDLPATTVQQDALKGGPLTSGMKLNHNETLAEEQKPEGAPHPEDTPAPADLETSAEHAVQGGGWGYSTSTIRLNHNEAIAEDSREPDPVPEVPADLPPAGADLEALKGGPISGTMKLNHAETLASELPAWLGGGR